MISMVSIFLVLMLTIGGSPLNPTNPAYNNGSASVVHPESTAGRININAKPRLGPKKIFPGIRGKNNPVNAGTIYKNKNKKSNSRRGSCYGYNKTHMKTYEQRGHNNNAGDVYTYDDVFRLTNVKFNVPDPTVPNPTEFEKEKTFNFDKLDNIMSIVETQNEQTTTKTTQINSILNQYENFAGWGLSYDLNGNTTQKGTQHFTYNYRNQIIKAQDQTTEANYKYDALGRRVQKAVTVGSATKTTNYYYSGMHVIEERDGSDNVLNQYIYGNGIDDILRMDKYNGTSSTPYYFHTDGIGSVTAITDENGNPVERVSYDPYGMPTFTNAAGEVISKSTIGNTLLFHGRRYDAENNLYYFRARYYDPIMGRFLQTDPMGYEDSMNLYQGFNMNPVNFVDPLGLFNIRIDTGGGNYLDMAAGWGKWSENKRYNIGEMSITGYKDEIIINDRLLLTEHGYTFVLTQDEAYNIAQAINMGMDFVPIIGTIKGIVEAYYGEDFAGNKMALWERFLQIPGMTDAIVGSFKIISRASKQMDVITGLGKLDGISDINKLDKLEILETFGGSVAKSGKASRGIVKGLEEIGFDTASINRIVQAAESGQPIVVIGEKMHRVEKMASTLEKLGLEVKIYKPRPGTILTPGKNRSWFRYWVKEKNSLVIDMGRNPGARGNLSRFYGVEFNSIYINWKYEDVINVKPGF